jgi:hypothetical protein
MPLNIHDELHSLLDALHRRRVSYALCGGLAVAVYGIVRATEDIDLLVEEASLGKVRAVAEGLGFRFDPKPLDLKRGRIRIYRLFKTAGEDLLKLDLLLVTRSTQAAWSSRRTMRTDLGPAQVVSPRGLISSRLEAAARTKTTSENSRSCAMKIDMSPQAITRRLQRVSELVRVCRALAGPRRRQDWSSAAENRKQRADSRSRRPQTGIRRGPA